MIAWGRMIMNAMNGFRGSKETGLVRMFRVEYAKEYQHLQRLGCEINDSFVKQFLSDRKNSQTT